MLGLHNIIALQLPYNHSTTHSDGSQMMGENGKGWKSCCHSLAPLGRWELQVLGHTLAPESQRAPTQVNERPPRSFFCISVRGQWNQDLLQHHRWCLLWGAHYTSYGNGWGCAPQLHRRLLVSSASKTSPRSSMEASSSWTHVADTQSGRGNLSEQDQALQQVSKWRLQSSLCSPRSARSIPNPQPAAAVSRGASQTKIQWGLFYWLVSRTAVWRIRTW